MSGHFFANVALPDGTAMDLLSSSSSSEEEDVEGYTRVGSKKRTRKPAKSTPAKALKASAPQLAPRDLPESPPPERTATAPLSPPLLGPTKASKALPRPPPLFIQEKGKWNQVSTWCRERHINYSSARATEHGIKVQVGSSADHRALTKLLKERDIPFYTYALPEERALRVIIRGIPHEIPTEEVQDSLRAQNLPVLAVHRMHNSRQKRPYNMVIVHLDQGEAGKAIFKVTAVCNLSGIHVESPRKGRFPSQCRKCQLYGHSARHCHARPRCVKCLGDHATDDCTRPKDRSLCTEPPACVLCGSVGHPANYRGCPKAPRPPKMVRAHHTRPIPIASQAVLAPSRLSP